MSPQGPGMAGALPWPAWMAAVSMLSSPESDPEAEWPATVLEMRRTCRALADLVGEGCVGGAGRFWIGGTDEIAQLEAFPTASLGRALVVTARLEPASSPAAVMAALAMVVERGHMVMLDASFGKYTPDVARGVEASLVRASRNGLLLHANLVEGEENGWSVDALSQLGVITLLTQSHETVSTLVHGGALRCISLWECDWADVSILSSLRQVTLNKCLAVQDLSPLADVSRLVISECHGVRGLSAMRNDVLELRGHFSLADVSGLASCRVGHLTLNQLYMVEDVSAIGAMRPTPRTVNLEGLPRVKDVSMLAGIHRLEIVVCALLDKATTLAALEGKVGIVKWR